jgi:hypothetical protein
LAERWKTRSSGETGDRTDVGSQKEKTEREARMVVWGIAFAIRDRSGGIPGECCGEMLWRSQFGIVGKEEEAGSIQSRETGYMDDGIWIAFELR